MTIHRSRLHRRRPGIARPGPVTRRSSAVPRSLLRRMRDRLASDQGDVPGWVLITLMTAGIVVALWAVASEQIVRIFENAMAPFLNGGL